MVTLQEEVPATWKAGKILLCGEAPGAEEVRKGEGFVGASGRLLDRMLGAAGLSRAEVSLCNVVRRRPPDNDFSVFYEAVQIGKKKIMQPTDELLRWREKLREDIATHKPSVVVAVGQEAMRALLGMEGISNRRGSAWRMEGGPWVIPMVHPKNIAGNWLEVVIGAHCCLKRAAWIAAQGEGWEPEPFDVQIVSEGELYDVLREIVEGWRWWALDLETIPGDGVKAGAISVLSLAYRDEKGVTQARVLPWPRGEVWRWVYEALVAAGEWVCGHNFNYDRTWLRSAGAWPEGVGVGLDTMQTWKRTFAELPKSLDFCAMWAFGHQLPYWKDEGKKLHAKRKKTDEEQIAYWIYGAKDAVGTLWLAEWLEKQGGMSALDKDLWRWSAEMTDRGLPLHYAAVHRLSAVARTQLQETQEALAVLEPRFGWRQKGKKRTLGAASSQLVMQVLYNELGLPVQLKGKQRTADEDALKQLQRIQPTALVGKLLTWRKLDKLITGFLNVLETATRRDDETLYCGWIAAATKSWRYASSNHPLGGGLNAQTVPSCLRYLITAPPGRIFLQPDLSQAEARYVAARARCRSLLALFHDPTKSIHLERAKQIYGREIAKDTYEYMTSKRVVHGTNYLMGVRRLAQQCGIAEKEAKVLLAKAKAPYPEIGRWQQEVRHLAQSQGRLTNCFGLSRMALTALGGIIATGRVTDEAWKDLVAWEPQSSIPHIVYLAMGELKKFSEHDELWFHMHGHDSFLGSVPEEAVEYWGARIKEALTIPIQVQGIELIIPVDVQVGRTWGQMTKLSEGWRERLDAMPRPEEVDPQAALTRTLESIINSLGEEEEFADEAA